MKERFQLTVLRLAKTHAYLEYTESLLSLDGEKAHTALGSKKGTLWSIVSKPLIVSERSSPVAPIFLIDSFPSEGHVQLFFEKFPDYLSASAWNILENHRFL